jgi:ribosomal-protein-alanine N-acetyltransferase
MRKLLKLENVGILALDQMQDVHLDNVINIENKAYPFPWTRSMFVTSLSSKDDCLILLLDQVIVGYAIVSYILDEAHLLNLCISPEFEGKGLGRILLKELVIAAIKKQSLMFFLEVRCSNSRAISLYFSEGFNEVGLRPNYYPSDNGGREDAILMTLDLSIDIFA